MIKILFFLLIFPVLILAETEVVNISFKHSSKFDKDNLLDIIHSEEGEEFEPRLLKLDRILLNNFFQKNGYLLVSVTDSLFFNDERTELHIKYIIENGPLYNFGGVNFITTNMQGAWIINSNLVNADFSGADMKNANLAGSDWFPRLTSGYTITTGCTNCP